MATYIRVKNKKTGHEFDLLEEQFDSEKHTRVDAKRYPPTSRPRRPKPNVSKGGGPARRPASTNRPVDTEKE